MIKIEKITLNDMKELANMFSGLFNEYHSLDTHYSVPNESFIIETLQKELLDPSVLLLKAVSDEKAIGFIHVNFWEKDPFRSQKIAFIHNLYVHSQYRNQGTGKLLVDSVVTECKTRGYKRIELNTDTKSKALDFWKKNEFDPTTLRMKKEL